MEFLKVVADYLDVIDIVYTETDGTIKNAVVGFDEDAFHVDIELLRDDVGNLVHHTHAIDTLDVDGYGEVEQLVGTPLGSDDAIAVAGLKLGCFGTFALVDNDLAVVADKSEHVVTRDGMAACSHLIGTLQSFIGEDEGAFLINFLHVQVSLHSFLVVLALTLVATEETSDEV